MSVAASRPPAPVVVPAPVPAPTPADREPGSARFAEMLRQSRGVERRPPADAPTGLGEGRGSRSVATPEASASASATTTPSAGDEAAPVPEGSPRSEAARARARGSASASRTVAERSAGRGEGAGRDNAAGPARDATEEDETASTGVGAHAIANPAHGLRPDPRAGDAELRFGVAARRLAGNGPSGSDGDIASLNERTGESGATEPASPARRPGSDAPGRADIGRETGRAARAVDGQVASAAFAQKILGEAQAGDRPTGPAVASKETASSLAGPMPAQDAPAPAAVDHAPVAQAATVAVPLDSPEFPAAFGVQVSVLVKDGVQQAELHLNPAETGPVSIAITLEGTQAHVEFGADLAATRQAIENGLPALASALRDAGFTLAGGGVAQHSRSGGGGEDAASRDDRGSRPARRAIEPAAPAVTQRTSHRMSTGGIDLYA